jgi:pimeloyl-ACP methyl ester carboxylesterase
MNRKSACLLLLALFLAACGRPTAGPTPAPLPSSTPVPSLPPPSVTTGPTATRVVPPVEPTGLPTPSEPTPIALSAPDGASLAGTYYTPIVRPAPAVLLLHMLGGSKADWDTFARVLQKQGYAVLAFDLRGFGASARPEDWSKAPADVRGVWQTLISRPDVDVNRNAILGASIGANLSLMVSGTEPRVTAAVALSPGLDFHGLNPSSAMSGFAQRPVYLVASQDDAYSYNSAGSLARLSISAETLYFDTAGHGTAMLGREPALEQTLVDWLNRYVRDLK